MARRDTTKTPPDAPAPQAEGRSERRAWIIAYVVIVAFLAVGAARRIWSMF